MPVAHIENEGDEVKEYYQVLGWFEDDADRPNIQMLDLDRRGIKKRFIKPYKGGDKIFFECLVRDLSQVKRVAIFKTSKSVFDHVEDDDRASLNSVDQFNATSMSAVMFSIPNTEPWQSARHNGLDVTKEFIQGPPGAKSLLAEFVNHPWVLGIGLVVITGLLAFFGLG